MKYIFIFLFFTISQSQAQSKFALLDKKLKIPILYTDSITVEQIDKGYFPVENKNIDTLIANLKYLNELLDKRQRSKMQSFELRQASSIFSVVREPHAYGDRYNSIATTHSDNISARFKIINSSYSNKQNQNYLEKLLAYLKSNQSFYKEPYEVTPKIYNVVVVTE